MSETKRQEEINFAINFIESHCNTVNIALIPIEHKGVQAVGILDNLTGKKYLIAK